MIPLYSLDFETEGLDPTKHKITSAAIYEGDKEGSGPESVIAFDDAIEERLLINVRDFFESPWTKPGVIITWNGSTFDFPFLITRAEQLNIPLWDFHAELSDQRPPKYTPIQGHAGGYAIGWKGHTHADIWPAFVEFQQTLGIKGSLKDTGRALDLEMIEVDRTKMEDLTPQQRCVYNVSDVYGAFKLAQMIDRLYEEGVCPLPLKAYFDAPLIGGNLEFSGS